MIKLHKNLNFNGLVHQTLLLVSLCLPTICWEDHWHCPLSDWHRCNTLISLL